MGTAAAASSTTIVFDRRVDLEQYAVTASLGQTLPSGLALRGSLGAVLDGTLTDGAATHDLGPGFLVGAAVSRPWTRASYFAIGSASLSASHTRAASPITAIDARLGVMAGRTLGPFSPYLLARAFGGPVFWNALTGGDATHIQLGAGASLTLRRFSFVLDVSALGERAASLGVSYSVTPR